MFHKWVCSFRECRTNCQGSEDTTYEVYEGDNVLHGWRGSCWLGMEPVISSQEKLGPGPVQCILSAAPSSCSGLVARSRHGRRYPRRLGSPLSTVGGPNRVKMGKIWQKMGWNGQIIGRIEENLKLPPVDLRWLLLYTEMWSDTRGWFFGGDTRRYFSNTKFNNNMEKWVWCSTSISTNVIYFLSNMIRKIYYLK